MKKLIIATVAILSASSAFAATDADRKWVEYTRWAYERSAQQNGGRAIQTRGCQPELALCTLAIFYRNNKGVEVVARDTYNSRDVLIRRDVCEFNQSNDIRVCTNWDTGEVQRHMKGQNGEWALVNDQSNGRFGSSY